MFIKLKDGRKLNLIYLSDCFIGKHDQTQVIFYLVNSVKIVEGYNSREEAEARVKAVMDSMESARGGGLIQKDSINDFPAVGNKGYIYVDVSTGITYYWDSVSNTYVSTGTAGRTGVYSFNDALLGDIGDSAEISKSDLTVLLEPSSAYQEGSQIIGTNGVYGIITNISGNKVIVKVSTKPTAESYKEVQTLDDLPAYNGRDILFYVRDEEEFRVWNTDKGEYVNPIHTIITIDEPVETANKNTLYVIGNEIKFTSDNVNWNYIDSTADMYELNTDYHKDKLLYLDNTLVKVLKNYKSPNVPDDRKAFYRDIELGNLEVIVEGKISTTVTYDLTNQLNGNKQTFNIDASITPDKSMLVFYAGQLLLENVNYTVNYTNHTIKTLFDEAPDSDEDRHLVVIVGEMAAPNFVMSVTSDFDLVDNTDKRNPKILQDSTKVDKKVAKDTNNKIVGNVDIKQDNKDIIVTKTNLNVDTNTSNVENVTLKSSSNTVKFDMKENPDKSKELDISAFANVKVYQNIFSFDGDTVGFDLPADFDFDRPRLVIVNGLVLSEGIDCDYTINPYNKKLTFIEKFDTDTNCILINL